MEEDILRSRQRIDDLERKIATTKRFLGIVRYDAFEDVGGAQSFALALYDDRGDGAVISGLIGRNESRVYCKELAGGRSERNLSDEERRAIELAAHDKSRPIISP
jgi:hypothetical protein